jgi:hypothetical protein
MTTKPKTRTEPAKDALGFDGMNIEINVEKQRKNWGATFTSVQTAMRFCNFDHIEATAAVRDWNETDEPDESLVGELGSDWADRIEYLKSAIAIMEAACARLELSRRRAKEPA